MKKKISFLIISFFCFSISFANAHVNNTIPRTDTIIGYFSFDVLEESPFSDWFILEYSTYQVDNVTLDSIKTDDLTELKILIVIGTWCHDSQRETPRFVKIMEHLGFNNIEAIGVNRQKHADGTEVPDLNIQYVPTIIFYKGKTEIGRIIETPIETLEKDILKIIKSNYGASLTR